MASDTERSQKAQATGADASREGARPTPAPLSARKPRRAPDYDGLCTVCGAWSTFLDVAIPIRETYQCKLCRALMRERVMAAAVLAACGRARAASLAELAASDDFAALSIYEPGVSGAYRRYLSKIEGYMNSFYWENGIPGQETNGVRHEDLMNLTFANERFDLMISSDILEHVRRPWEAFRESHRVLKPGGMHIFSIPALVPMRSATCYRADTSGQEDVHLMEPYYHGDGRGGKSLVYTEYGGDFLDKLEQIGFRTFSISHDHTDAERARVIAFISAKT